MLERESEGKNNGRMKYKEEENFLCEDENTDKRHLYHM